MFILMFVLLLLYLIFDQLKDNYNLVYFLFKIIYPVPIEFNKYKFEYLLKYTIIYIII